MQQPACYCSTSRHLTTICPQPPTSTDEIVRGGAHCAPLPDCSTGSEKLSPSLLSCVCGEQGMCGCTARRCSRLCAA